MNSMTSTTTTLKDQMRRCLAARNDAQLARVDYLLARHYGYTATKERAASNNARKNASAAWDELCDALEGDFGNDADKALAETIRRYTPFPIGKRQAAALRSQLETALNAESRTSLDALEAYLEASDVLAEVRELGGNPDMLYDHENEVLRTAANARRAFEQMTPGFPVGNFLPATIGQKNADHILGDTRNGQYGLVVDAIGDGQYTIQPIIRGRKRGGRTGNADMVVAEIDAMLTLIASII